MSFKTYKIQLFRFYVTFQIVKKGLRFNEFEKYLNKIVESENEN